MLRAAEARAAKLRAFFGALSTLQPWMLGIERHREEPREATEACRPEA